MRIGRGECYVRDTHHTARCRVCNEGIVKGHVSACFSINREVMHFHRMCMKQWLEFSYDVLPMTPDEMNMDRTGNNIGQVEIERGKREFDEYREALLQRFQQ